MKLSHIRDVVAAAECGSLRAAARQLGITQPAITRSICEIENGWSSRGAVMRSPAKRGSPRSSRRNG